MVLVSLCRVESRKRKLGLKAAIERATGLKTKAKLCWEWDVFKKFVLSTTSRLLGSRVSSVTPLSSRRLQGNEDTERYVG